MVMIKQVIEYVLMERKWKMVKERIQKEVVRDIEEIIDIIEKYKKEKG